MLSYKSWLGLDLGSVLWPQLAVGLLAIPARPPLAMEGMHRPREPSDN